ncbi:MAG TPA: phasin [Edaphobacter sp.]|nr:phasin [Bauldia sp.]HZY74188.1 phasin [Edaphobacter sp.]
MTTATNGKKAKPASAPFEAFTFPTPTFEVPAAVREFAEKSVSQAREAYDKFRTAADDATGLVEETLETAREGAVALGLKAVDAAKVNSEASFSFARDLFGAKTMSDVIELQSTFARKQFDTFTSQFREFQALTEKMVADAAKPVSEKVEKTFKDMKVA